VSRTKAIPRVIRLQIQDGLGNPRWITADLVDTSECGISISIRMPLTPGSKIGVRGKVGEWHLDELSPATIAWCAEQPNGSFRAGLEFGDGLGKTDGDADPAHSIDTPELDCYETLQLSPNADAETIQRVYRILAQRYHPDSATTGNPELFLRVSEAHRILSDPERRAKYDATYRETRQLHWKIFDKAESTLGREAERRKRQGILELLYAKALHNPERFDLTIFDFEELLGCPREHLEAALWYLKGKGFIKRGDHGRFTITIQGFDEVETLTRVVDPAQKLLAPESTLRG
jgi:hypothetical protein